MDKTFSSTTAVLFHQHDYGNNRLAEVLLNKIQWPEQAQGPVDECKHLKVIPHKKITGFINI